MNGVHDMGGMHGFGPVVSEENEPVFHEEWEGRVFGMSVGFGGKLRTGGRFELESLDPADYLKFSYYQKWMQAMENSLVERGVITAEELEAKTEHYRQNPEAPVPKLEDPERVPRSISRLRLHSSPVVESDTTPRFNVGDRVRARNVNPPGHTRLPRYVRGKLCVIASYFGIHELQDTENNGDSQPVYSVRFEGAELWGEAAEPNQALYIDMWESYLEPA